MSVLLCCFALSPDLLFLSCLAFFVWKHGKEVRLSHIFLAVGRVDVRVKDSRVRHGVESFKPFLGGERICLFSYFCSCLVLHICLETCEGGAVIAYNFGSRSG